MIMEKDDGNTSRRLFVLLYILAFLIAFLLRFIKLGALPLGDAEAVNALQAMKIARGQAVTIGSQPGYIALTSILFFIFKAGEFWARFWPALFGVGLVFVPLLYKKWIGEKGALILAFLLAIEPGLTATSRMATGTMIGLVSLFVALGFYLNHKSIPAGLFFGLAILGGIAIWPGLIALGITLLIYSLSARKWPEITIPSSTHKEVPGSPFNWKAFGFSSVGSVLLLGTIFLLKPIVISGLGSSLVDYFKSWLTMGTSLKVLTISVLVEQLMAIPLAIWGVITGWRKKTGLTFMMLVGLLVSLALTIANPSSRVVDLVWVLIPLWVLAAFGFEEILGSLTETEFLLKLFQTIITFSLLIFTSMNILSAVVKPNNSSEISPWVSILLPIALLIVITLLIGWGWSVEASKQGLLIGIGLILIATTVGSAWKAGGLGSQPETELWRADSLPAGRDLLLKQVNELSLWNTGQEENKLHIALLRVQSPSLEWALRNYTIQDADILGSTETPAMVITTSTDTTGLAQIYRGQAFNWAKEVQFDQLTVSDWVKWYGFRQVPTIDQGYLLWARTDLFK
jgi:hypothetical protein